MSSPRRPSFFFSFFLTPFSSSTAPQAFPRPDRRMLPPARAGCVKAGPLFSGPPSGLGLYTTEHDGRLDGFGRLLLSSVTYPSSCQRALFRSGNVLSVGLATKSMARAMVASTYIRQLRSGLPRCCLHGRSRREGWGSSVERQIGQSRSANAEIQPHIRPARHTRLGVSELSASLGQRYRVRVAPCGTRPMLEIAPEGNGELARHCNDHDALDAPILPFGPLHKPLGEARSWVDV